MSQRSPRLIGGVYQVGQLIASSPLVNSYTGYNRNTGDVVGLLVLELPPMMGDDAAQRLLQPLERRRQVQSQNVIHVYDFGIENDRVYIATDPPRGVTLRYVMDNDNIDMSRAVDLAQQLARGLVALQTQGIVDTDLRPQLVTVDIIGMTDRVQIDDVGQRTLLRQLGFAPGQYIDDIAYLDPRYVAPECIQNGPIGPWTDVYQLGLVLFEMITGRVPFVGRTSAETGVMQSTSPLPLIAQFRHDTPPVLQALLEQALAKDPARRFPNAAALLKALETVPLVKSGQLAGASFTPPAGSLPGIPGGGHTTEMVSLPQEDDLTLHDTLIDGEKTVRRQPPKSAPLVPQEEGVLAYLYFEKEGEEPRRFPIKDKYVIVGRVDPKRGLRPEIDLTPIDPNMTVSRQHARIRYEKTFFYIEDLKSRNKTRLGELTLTPLKAELLQHGDVLHFGSVRMVFKVPGMKDIPGNRQ
ncbi:MAG TPA: FHA domain-containing serine/threonine-protein kinase [Ktedonobacteraceae bacterium]|jgi:serine/threonine protein kinase|nr:FHA domain-containing serine/threonine-protein kinase [Ktedonobacteraceae bacterium]